MARTDNSCQYCLNSRAIVPENGIHWVCCLSEKKALECKRGVKDHYDGYDDFKEGE